MGGRGSSSGIRDGMKVRASGGGNTLLTSKSYEVSEQDINASESDALEKLRAMARRGEIPMEIRGSPEQREKLYEEFVRIYGTPPGALNEYELKPVIDGNPNLVRIEFTNQDAIVRGIRVENVKYLRKGQGSELSRQGQVNHAILKARLAMEAAASMRGLDGFPNIELGQKYGRRILSNAEKEQADREINAFVRKVMKSPISRSGQRYLAQEWKKVSGGWIRAGSEMNAEMVMKKVRDNY